MRTGIAFVRAILALLLHTNTYAFSVAGNVYGRSAPVASTVGSPDVGSPHVPSNYRIWYFRHFRSKRVPTTATSSIRIMCLF